MMLVRREPKFYLVTVVLLLIVVFLAISVVGAALYLLGPFLGTGVSPIVSLFGTFFSDVFINSSLYSNITFVLVVVAAGLVLYRMRDTRAEDKFLRIPNYSARGLIEFAPLAIAIVIA